MCLFIIWLVVTDWFLCVNWLDWVLGCFEFVLFAGYCLVRVVTCSNFNSVACVFCMLHVCVCDWCLMKLFCWWWLLALFWWFWLSCFSVFVLLVWFAVYCLDVVRCGWLCYLVAVWFALWFLVIIDWLVGLGVVVVCLVVCSGLSCLFKLLL